MFHLLVIRRERGVDLSPEDAGVFWVRWNVNLVVVFMKIKLISVPGCLEKLGEAHRVWSVRLLLRADNVPGVNISLASNERSLSQFQEAAISIKSEYKFYSFAEVLLPKTICQTGPYHELHVTSFCLEKKNLYVWLWKSLSYINAFPVRLPPEHGEIVMKITDAACCKKIDNLMWMCA